MALIHIVIPCYNVEKYLEVAVDSILNQPYEDVDIVLVDDGSPGNTPELCDRLAFEKSRVYVIHQKNGGLCSARNAGIEYILDNLVGSSNDYIGFLDGDDAWCVNVITKDFVDVLLNKKIDVVGFSGVYSNSSMERFSPVITKDDYDELKGTEAMWIAQKVHLASKLYSVNLFREYNLRFLEKQLYTEDKIFVFQACFLAEKVKLIAKPLHIYRKNEEGIMSKLRELNAIEHYLPIVDGWLRSDDFLNALSKRTGRYCKSGTVLATIYLIQMAAEYIKKGGKRAVVAEIIEKHVCYKKILDANSRDYDSESYKLIQLYLKHPKLFSFLFYSKGIFERIAYKLLKIQFVQRIREERRYPYTEVQK